MNRADLQQWGTAQILEHLGDLTVAWLHGEITGTPYHAGPPAPETHPHVEVLAGVNRAGLVTVSSRPGDNGACARVAGLISGDNLPRLAAAVAGTPLVLECRDYFGGGHESHDQWCAVTRWYMMCSPRASVDLRMAWYVTVSDPEPGRDSVLWPALAAFADPCPGPAAVVVTATCEAGHAPSWDVCGDCGTLIAAARQGRRPACRAAGLPDCLPVIGVTSADVLTVGVEQGWAEPETDPARIDWPARQAAAAVPFDVTGGRPVNPGAVTGVRHGRNELGRWGENLMADALVTVTYVGVRYLLMVERGDGYGWAVPGGAAEPGETAVQAAARELAEETGLDVPRSLCRAGEPLYVPDPRASDEAWAVTVPVAVDLGETRDLPEVNGADDARRAEWIPAAAYLELVTALDCRYGGRVFAAHADMLQRFLRAVGS